MGVKDGIIFLLLVLLALSMAGQSQAGLLIS